MDSDAKSAAPALSTDLLPTGTELRGSVLDVLKALLPELDERDAVLGIVGKLVAENSTMAQRLARIAVRFKTSEKISKAQRVLFADVLRRGEGEPELEDGAALEPDEVDTADERLRAAAGLDDKEAADLAKLRTGRPPPQPHSRAAAPEHLPRVDNPIAVPAEQRACPKCGAERTCIGHDVSTVIDLIPAQVIVRRDLREKLDNVAATQRTPTSVVRMSLSSSMRAARTGERPRLLRCACRTEEKSYWLVAADAAIPYRASSHSHGDSVVPARQDRHSETSISAHTPPSPTVAQTCASIG